MKKKSKLNGKKKVSKIKIQMYNHFSQKSIKIAKRKF